MQTLTGRGGILHGQRLIFALIAVTLIFFLAGRESPTQSIVPSKYGDQNPETPSASYESADDISPPSGVEESGSLSDKLFEYLRGKGQTSDKVKATAPVPFAEYAQTAASPKPSITASTESMMNQEHEDHLCSHIPRSSEVLLVVWSPAAYLYAQLPFQSLTTLRCVDSIVFSTVTQTLGGHTIHNALENITEYTQESEKDFELYRKLQIAQRAHIDLSGFTEDTEHNLDKWGIVPSLLAAYRMYPDKKWFIFMESDTYISIPNLLPWLSRLDSTTPIYAGAQVMIGEVEFAHSGSGIVLSAPVLKALSDLDYNNGFNKSWETVVAENCCGDKVLADLLKEADIYLTRSFPLLQGETPFSLDWSARHWCKAVVSWHRMTPQMLDTLFTFERNWSETHTVSHSSPEFGSHPPILFKDLFNYLLLPLIHSNPNITNWDNLASFLTYTDSSGTGSYAHMTFDSCRAACDLRQECVQFAWEPNKCRLGNVVKFGEPVAQDKRMISGWVQHRVERFGEMQVGDCGKEDPYVDLVEEKEREKMAALLTDDSTKAEGGVE
jgi:hypothetical protein